MANLTDAPLGKSSLYVDQYDPTLLFPVPRDSNRATLNIAANDLPFQGYDIWNAWEISWLNGKGKPIVATAEITIPAASPFLIESKSFKLYLNSYNQTRFDSLEQVREAMIKDLSEAAKAQVEVILTPLSEASGLEQIHTVAGFCLDDLDVTIDSYTTDAGLLRVESDETVSETLFSQLMKSNCPVTGQPDWGTVIVKYTGRKISADSLLKYIVSFRQHTEFHEHCVERIFMDLLNLLQPTALQVSARYVRRGGLDINPFRSLTAERPDNLRLLRQ